jgi:putative addiction module component (TIGR02574 family)
LDRRVLSGYDLAIMSDADIAEILKLPADERLRLLEIIWESLASDPSSLPLSDAHRAALDDALADLKRNPDDVISLDEVMANARRR